MLKLDAPQYEVKKAKLNQEEQDALMNYLSKEHSETLNSRKDYEKKWKVWANQGNGRRKRVGAGARDSDIDVPTTREYMMQNSARVQTPILQHDDPMVAVPTAPKHEDVALKLEPFINYMMRRVNLRVFMENWIEQTQLFNAGYVKTSFSTEYEFVKRWVELSPDEDPEILSSAGVTVIDRKLDDGTVLRFKEQESKRIKRAGCFPEIIPIEDVIHPLTAMDVDSAEWITHRTWPTINEIKFKIKEGLWEKKTVNGDDVLDLIQKSERERFLYPVENPEEQNPSSAKQYDIRETYLIWEVDDEPCELIVTWEPVSKTFLSIIYNFFHEYHRPFVVHQYKPVQNLIYGIPLTYIIEPLHIAYSASINQRLDAASLANETLIFGPPNLDLQKQTDATIRGGYYATNATKDEIWQLNLGTAFSQLPELEDTLEQHMQKLSGLSDYSFGQEQVGRPTMGGTMQLVEESKHPQYLQLERFRDSLATVAKHMLSRYKQFYPEGVRVYEMAHPPEPDPMNPNAPPMSVLQTINVTWPEGSIEDSIIIQTKVSSSTMSKNMRKQEIMGLVDKMPQIYQTLGQFAFQASTPNPEAPANAMIALSLLNSYQKVIDKFMTEFEVADKSVVNPPLVQEAQVVQQINQQFMQLNQQLQQCSNALAGAQQQLAAYQQAYGPPPPGMAQQAPQQPGPQGPPPMGPGA